MYQLLFSSLDQAFLTHPLRKFHGKHRKTHLTDIEWNHKKRNICSLISVLGILPMGRQTHFWEFKRKCRQCDILLTPAVADHQVPSPRPSRHQCCWGEWNISFCEQGKLEMQFCFAWDAMSQLAQERDAKWQFLYRRQFLHRHRGLWDWDFQRNLEQLGIQFSLKFPLKCISCRS